MTSQDSPTYDFDDDSRESPEILEDANSVGSATPSALTPSRSPPIDVGQNETESSRKTIVEDINRSSTADNGEKSFGKPDPDLGGGVQDDSCSSDPAGPNLDQHDSERADNIPVQCSSDENTEPYDIPTEESNSKKDMGNNRSKGTKNKQTLMTDYASGKPARPKLTKRWSDYDTEQYRAGYPGKEDFKNAKDNLMFYTNKLASQPDGDLIDNIHKKWKKDYDLLEQHHGYIQWLFPIRESGMNYHAQELQLHEAKAIKADKEAHERVLKSYELMLDFYGMKLKDSTTGGIERAPNWRERFRHLNRSTHNHLRITRILKSLGELGYEQFQYPFVEFVLNEALVKKTLTNCIRSCRDYWMGAVKNDKERETLEKFYEENGGR